MISSKRYPGVGVSLSTVALFSIGYWKKKKNKKINKNALLKLNTSTVMTTIT